MTRKTEGVLAKDLLNALSGAGTGVQVDVPGALRAAAMTPLRGPRTFWADEVAERALGPGPDAEKLANVLRDFLAENFPIRIMDGAGHASASILRQNRRASAASDLQAVYAIARMAGWEPEFVDDDVGGYVVGLRAIEFPGGGPETMDRAFRDLGLFVEQMEPEAAPPDLLDIALWRGPLAEIVAEEADENHGVRVVHPGDRVPMGHGALVVVHPGDASDEPGVCEALERMTRTLRETRLDPFRRVVIVHRFSSAYMDPSSDMAVEERPACARWFSEVVKSCDDQVTVQVYGDHMDQVAEALAPEIGDAGGIVLTGLWGDGEDGCVTALAESLKSLGLAVEEDPDCPRARDRAPSLGL